VPSAEALDEASAILCGEGRAMSEEIESERKGRAEVRGEYCRMVGSVSSSLKALLEAEELIMEVSVAYTHTHTHTPRKEDRREASMSKRQVPDQNEQQQATKQASVRSVVIIMRV
jgi:hypothetical protein